MPKKAERTNPFEGVWRITGMEGWDQEFVDEEEEGYFEFEPKERGEFHFGNVHGQIDYRVSIRDGKPCIEFTWDGEAEMDSVQGRGWAIVEGDILNGEIFFHLGDESSFRARKKRVRRR
jgi:hypothetical protein